MTKMHLGVSVAAWTLAVAAASVGHAQVTIASDEIWDGASNPRAGEGVTLSGNVYTIPGELIIGAGATLFLNDPATRYDDLANVPTGSITLEFTPGAGGLTFADASSTLDVHPGTRNAGTLTLTLNMQDNNIAGTGRIINGPFVGSGDTGDAMSLNINSSANVVLGAINIARNDASSASVSVTAGGVVDIGEIRTDDVSGGGSSAGGVNIKGQSLNLGSIDTRAHRGDGQANNGEISLTALDPPSFDAGNGLGNRADENSVMLNGAIVTNAPSDVNPGGNVSITGVKVVLGSGYSLDLSENATSTIHAGVVGAGFSEADLFMDMASSGLAANFTVEHGIPEPSAAALLLLSAAASGRRLRVRSIRSRS